MFEIAERRGRRRWRGPGAAISIAAHVVAVAWLYAAAVWRVDKLEIESMPLFVAAPLVASRLEEGEAPSRPPVASDRPMVRRACD